MQDQTDHASPQLGHSWTTAYYENCAITV